MENQFLVVGTVVACCALLAWLASQGRQPIVLAYFLCGVLIGPPGIAIVRDTRPLGDISHIGVVLLLFLAGLVLHPDRLLKFFRTAVVVTIAGSAFVWIMVFAACRLLGYGARDSMIAAMALMFSSTILVVKLLPTTTLHQKRMGSVCIAILIAEDLLAVLVLLFVAAEKATAGPLSLVTLPVTAVLLIAGTVAGEQFVLRPMMRKADRYEEVLVMLCLGWCVGIAAMAEAVHVPYEVGAFVAGVAMARGKIAYVLSEQLKPLRDFFLMFFFFTLGAAFDFTRMHGVWLSASIVAVLILALRPLWFAWLFRRMGEENDFAIETGFRLGQASEFALIIAVAAARSEYLSHAASQFVQLVTVLTMVVSSYLVVFRYPTPIGFRPGLQKT